MPVRPNKPVLFGIDHKMSKVKKNLVFFKGLVRGKKRLYIELTPEDLNTPAKDLDSGIRSFRLLATVAQEAGLQIIPLDRNDWHQIFLSTRDSWAPDNKIYQNTYKREKMWAQTLRAATSDSVVAVHPAHALELKEQLKIPDENCVFTRNPQDAEYLERRRIGRNEAERIEKLRLARRLKNSRERQKRRPIK